MSDAIAEFFGRLGEGGKEPALHAVTGTLRFDLTDRRGTEHWLVTVEEGGVRVSRRNVKADCVVKVDRELFARIASGRVNAMAAVLRGLVVAEGDPQMFVKFQRLLPGPPSSRHPRRSAGEEGRS